MTFTCPSCGARHDGVTPPEMLADALRLSGQQRVIMGELTKAGVGVPVDYETIEAAMYSGVRDGGPENTRATRQAATHQLRVRLRRLGYTIRGSGGRGQRCFAVLLKT